ncbi:asparagine synthase B [Rubricoccus marinus]|uniref:asparagine synthase (glutamine-hydrolyzing) n=1 Tax=Rubricoccus marinus TaxID=716817 RepID=A0A259U337_9BACT|nr:asparagine synthase B [Rubricoccus marinus]OZC04443.1 asparagine synthase B [Rubricoccus marinus]
MCSILGILDLQTDPADARSTAVRLSGLQRHRGPDWSGVYASDTAVLAHERLAIVDVMGGAQPLLNPEKTHALAVNGEIYNHRLLRQRLEQPFAFQTDSDCEVILALYRDHGADFLDDLVGIFAFVLVDETRGRYLIARDPMGVMPLYTGRDAGGTLYVASEMKALVPVCETIETFPPGHVWDSEVGEPVRYYSRDWMGYDAVADNSAEPLAVREALEAAVKRQLMTDVPYGVLLSGGLDSSIIAATAKRFADRRIEADGAQEAWWPHLHSFAIGLEGSPDLEAAQKVADHIGTEHHAFHFTVQEGLDALSDVVRHLETFDVTTIRAATPMYLMARRIRAMGIKMVLSGEGADEIFGGYLYFHKAPDARAFHEETVRKLDRLHLFDCLRANKAMAAWGIEARVPFLDQEFLDVAMRVAPEAKRPHSGRMEKHLLREAFESALPASVAWRQKEQFSDGVGYAWIDSLRAHADAQVSDADFAASGERFPIHTPDTKEGYFYRTLFESHFPLDTCALTVPSGKSVACSTPEALAWDASFADSADPSGRAVAGVHAQAY